MSIHSSLRGSDTLKGERSVLTRQERIASLKKAGKFEEDKRSKVRTKFRVAGAKKKAAKEAVPGAPGAVGAPAAGAAGAAGAKGAAPAAKGAAAGAAKGAAPAAKAAPAAAKKGDKK